MFSFFKIYSTLLCLLFCVFVLDVQAQSGLCTPNTPFYTVDLTSDASATWTSAPPIVRAGSCCGSIWPDRCIEFAITLNADAIAINFEIVTGAVPGGAMFYQIGCGPLTKVGDPICVNGPGPHTLTFCKPGSNLNTYRITSIPGPTGGPDVTTSDGCTATFTTSGLKDVVWTDITSGNQMYNSYLSCTSCLSTIVTPQTGYPAYVDYRVCGMPDVGPCAPPVLFCDTVRANFISPIQSSINPNPAIYCETEAGILLTSVANGGKAPLTYTWRNSGGTTIGTNSTYFATAGTFNLEIRDALYPNCPAKFASATVTKELKPIVNAGSDHVVCATYATINLNGTVSNSSAWRWKGGGNFGSGPTALVNSYTPSAAEILAQKAIVILEADGITSACAPVADTLIITINPALTVNISAPTVVCFGQKANLTANITGGTPSYNILWNTGSTATSLFNQNPGTYSVTISDVSENTCSVNASVTITENPLLLISVPASTIIYCEATTDITALASGGNGGPYTYLWSTGSTNATATLYSGSYTVTATDGVGCKVTGITDVVPSNTNLSVNIAAIPNLCFGTTTTITPTISLGLAPYTYSWGSGENSLSVTKGAGTHCITVTDAGGCVAAACVTIQEDPLLSIVISGPALICNGSTANLTTQVTGGKSPYSYLWNSGETANYITKTAGTYSVSVRDANAHTCTASANFTINQASPLFLTLTPTHVSCFGGSTGSISSTVSGSVAPYNYSWNTGATSSSVSALAIGTFTLNVTDALGCKANASTTITQPTKLLVNITDSANVVCYGEANGSATSLATGGTVPYVYTWSPSGESTVNASNLSAGNNTVTVSDSKGCSVSDAVLITQPQALTLSASSVMVTCKNANNGSAKIIGQGGTRPYTYLWAPSGVTDSSAINLAPGTYTANIADAHGCINSTNILITEPDSLLSTISGSNISCYGGTNGTAMITATGGTLPYSHLWSTGNGGATLNFLPVGNYSVTTTDAKGCTYSKSISLTQPTAIVTAVSPDEYIRCDSIGKVYVSAAGGTGVYTYQWSNGATSDTAVVNSSGKYLVIVKDANGCQITDTAYVIPLNSTLSLSVNAPSHICYGTTTTITSTVVPGIPPFSFLWDTGDTTSTLVTDGGLNSLTVTDDAGCVFTAAIQVIEDSLLQLSINSDSVCFGAQANLVAAATGGFQPYSYLWNTSESGSSVSKGAGNYQSTVTDATGCSAVASAVVTQGAPLELNLVVGGVTCFGAADAWVESTVSGGFTPYTYQWSNSAGNVSGIYGLTVGTYTLTVTDKIGCSITATANVKGPSTMLTLSGTSTNISCFNGDDGSIQISANGGSAPYSYLWWQGDQTASLSNLTIGNYGMSITDSSGCVKDTQITITQPPLLQLSTTSTMVNCNGGNDGTATVLVTGGTAPYSYLWSPSGLTNSSAGNLTAGTHSVKVTDAKGCIKDSSAVLTEPTALTANVNTTAVTCYGLNNGKANVLAQGGTAPYTYTWDLSSSVDSFLYNLDGGNYSMTVLDAKGCPLPKNYTIAEPDTIKISLTVSNIVCRQACDGKIKASVSGGNIPYTFQWTGTTASDSIALNLCDGNYSVGVIDAKGCSASPKNTTLTDPPVFSLDSALTKNEQCYNDCKGEIEVYSTGGISYSLNNAPYANTNPFTALCAGNYLVKVQSSTGCVDSTTVSISTPDSISISINNDTLICPGSTVLVHSSSTGGTGVLTYHFDANTNNTTGDLTVNPTLTNTYKVFSEDENSCLSDTVEMTVSVADSLAVKAFSDQQICYGDSAEIYAVASGGDEQYTYLWSSIPSGFTSVDNQLKVAPLQTMDYEITVGHQCSAIKAKDTVTITIIPSPIIDFSIELINACVPGEVIYTMLPEEVDSTFSINWKFGDGSNSSLANPRHIYPVSGVYDVALNIVSPEGCVTEIDKKNEVRIYEHPKADFHTDAYEHDIYDAWFEFTSDARGAAGMMWYFGDGDSAGTQHEYHKYQEIKCYDVQQKIWNVNGCRDSITKQVCVKDVYHFFAPNAFTPNGDGINEFFVPQWHMMDESTYHIMIFDRWGELIYESYNAYAYWNGKRENNMRDAQIDTYVWKISHKDVWANPHEYIGRVSVLR